MSMSLGGSPVLCPLVGSLSGKADDLGGHAGLCEA